jgi:hypothetical protein
MAAGQNLVTWLEMQFAAARNDTLEEAARRLERKGDKWEREAQKHLPHHNSTCAASDRARRDTCNVHAKMLRDLKSDPKVTTTHSQGVVPPSTSALRMAVLAGGGAPLLSVPPEKPSSPSTSALDEARVERAARAMAKHSGWDNWDTAKTAAHTPNGNEPEEEREYWRDLARIALGDESGTEDA